MTKCAIGRKKKKLKSGEKKYYIGRLVIIFY